MIKISDLQLGDIVKATFEETTNIGEILRIDRAEKKAIVAHGDQEFWYDEKDLAPVPLDEEQLMNLKFEKKENEDGSVKYSKGAFRILLPKKGDFSHMEVWYRQEKSIIDSPIFVHQLQNHYLRMTKVHLTEETF
ncbi:MAG TPA: hypothetical protein VFN30_08440 [Chitinophagaceae bacterium]|nr:hypothetical protein [Chitinophagaceae bacterium]